MVTELHPDGIPVRVAGVVLLQATGSGQEDSNREKKKEKVQKEKACPETAVLRRIRIDA